MDRLVISISALGLALFGVAFQARIAHAAPGLWPFAAGLAAAFGAAFACGGGRGERLLRGKVGGWAALGGAAFLMALLLVFGRRYRGGLYLPGLINPSEFVKIGAVAFAAAAMARREGRPSPALFLGFGAVVALAALAGDFGLAAQLAITLAAMLFAVSWAWGSAAFGLVVAGFVFAAMFPAGHLAVRFSVWRDPFADATGSGWQTLQGLVAVVRGGAAGAGFGLGEVQNVPIVSSDFVYAALAEDLGLVGCAAVLAAWSALLAFAFRAARRAADAGRMGSALLASGLAWGIGAQIALNVGGVLNAVPMTGIPLPLVSHGGTSLVATLAACGILAGLAGGHEAGASPEAPPARRVRSNSRRPRARRRQAGHLPHPGPGTPL